MRGEREPRSIVALLGALGSVGLAALAALAVAILMSGAAEPVDFHFYVEAARDVRAGENPYPSSSYTPLSILGTVPFTYLPTEVADAVVKALLLVGVGATLAALGVRDWRCYAVVVLWPPVIAAVQTGNVSIPLALLTALVWRLRDREAASGVALGVGVAVKVIVWPLGVWLLAVRRRVAALWAVCVAAGLTAASFLVLGLDAIEEYPEALRAYPESALEGYSLDVLGEDLGLPSVAARVAMLGVAVFVVVSAVVVGRRGGELRSFLLAIAATLALAPYVWLHYFALLLVPVALVRTRLSALWLVPLGMWGFGAGTGNGSTVQAVVVSIVVTITLALAYRQAAERTELAPAAERRVRTTAVAQSR